MNLDDKITEEKRDQLIRRINELYDKGALTVQDWMAIYDVFLAACGREKAAAYERYLEDCLNDEEGGEGNADDHHSDSGHHMD